MSEGLWTGRFGGDPSCIGQKIILDGESYTVIGVMPEAFQFPYRTSRTQLWIPWEVPPQYRHDHDYRLDFVAARLKDHVPIDAAKRELRAIARRLEAAYPESNQGRMG